MSKILVEVYLPAADKTYDVFLPLESKIYEVIQMLSSIMGDLAGGFFTASDDTVVCYRDTGAVLDINKSVYELSLLNGSKLIII